MKKFRKKPVVIEAYQWFKGVDDYVTYLQYPVSADGSCKHCTKLLNSHGWVNTLEGGHIVCPGDWIIRGVKGELYPCKPDIFEMTNEPEIES